MRVLCNASLLLVQCFTIYKSYIVLYMQILITAVSLLSHLLFSSIRCAYSENSPTFHLWNVVIKIMCAQTNEK